MSNYKNEKDGFKRTIESKMKSIRNNIRDDFRTDPNFKAAVKEKNNDQNNTYIENVIKVFGWIKVILTADYTTSQVVQDKTVEELVSELKNKLDSIENKYVDKMKSDVESYVNEIVTEIEKSDFLTEVVRNPSIPYSEAKKEMSEL